MFLTPLAFFVAIAATIWFVILSEASLPAKIIVAALFVASLLVRSTRYAVAGLLLQTAIAIFVLIYYKAQA